MRQVQGPGSRRILLKVRHRLRTIPLIRRAKDRRPLHHTQGAGRGIPPGLLCHDSGGCSRLSARGIASRQTGRQQTGAGSSGGHGSGGPQIPVEASAAVRRQSYSRFGPVVGGAGSCSRAAGNRDQQRRAQYLRYRCPEDPAGPSPSRKLAGYGECLDGPGDHSGATGPRRRSVRRRGGYRHHHHRRVAGGPENPNRGRHPDRHESSNSLWRRRHLPDQLPPPGSGGLGANGPGRHPNPERSCRSAASHHLAR